MASYMRELFNRLVGSITHYWKDVSKPTDCIRQLSFTEENMELYNNQGVMAVTRVVFIESKKPIDEAMVTAVLEQVIQKFPVLRLKIQKNEGKMFWKEMDHVVADFKVDTSGDWLSCFQENSKMIFDSENGPLWRFTFVTNVDSDYMDKTNFKHQYGLLFGFHHAILDAKSSLKILNEIQLPLNISLKGSKPDVQNKVPVTKHSKPLEFFQPMELSMKEKFLLFALSIPVLGFFLSILLKFVISRGLKQENIFIKHIGLPAVSGEAYTSVKQIPFSKEETKELLVACKSRGVTVQSALQTASAMALYNLIKNPIISKEVDSLLPSLSVQVGCTINMKNLLPEIPRDAVGCYISLLSTELQVENDSDFWQLAAQSRRQIHHNQLAGAKGFLKMLYFGRKLQFDLVEQLSDPPYYGRCPGLLINYTNLGNCSFINLDTSAEARINGHTSGSSEHITGPLFAHSAVTILNRLNWSIVYYSNIHKQAVVDFYAAETQRILSKALASNT